MVLVYKPVFRITPYLLSRIDEASALRGWIENALLQVAWLPLLQREARAKATRSSTSIEGNPLTLAQVEAVGRGEKTGVHQRYEAEVINYLKAMRWIEKQAHSAINERAILKLHAILMQGLLPEEKCGAYKQAQNYVVNGRGIKFFTPPPPKETPRLMRGLLNWLNSAETKALHSVLACAVFHHRFVSIHPFADGNGRLARALGTWILYQRDFDSRHIFSLDDFFAKDRQRYYLKIEQARELDNDLTFWIEYVAEGITETLKNVKQRIEGLQVSTKHKIALTPRQEDLLRILRDAPAIGVFDLQEKLGLTRARINQFLMPLIKSGLVAKEGQSRATKYRLA